MKKKIAVLLIVAVMVFSLAMPSFATSNDIATPQVKMSSLRATYFDFYGASGTRYRVNFSSDTVGYNHIAVGDKVKVCQAYTRIVSGSPIAVDGIWGNQSDTALRVAQYNMGVSSDGICGFNTWNAFGYLAPGAPNVVKNLL